MQVDTKRSQGKLRKSARIFTNEPNKPEHTIEMIAEVWVPILVNPRNAHLRGIIGDKAEGTIHLQGQLEQPLTVEVLSNSIPDKVDVALKEVEKGRGYDLLLTNKTAQQGNYSGTIRLKTSYPENAELDIPVTGNIRPVLEIRPDAVNFGQMPLDQVKSVLAKGAPVRRSALVVLNKGTDLKIEKVETEHSRFKVTTKEMKPGVMFQLLIDPVAEKLKQGEMEDRLKVFTNKQAKPLELSVKLKIL